MNSRSLRSALGFTGELARDFTRCGIPRSAAALTYYFVLSVFPMLICINAFVGQLHVDAAALIGSLGHFLPPQALSVVEDYVRALPRDPSPILRPTGVTAVLLSGSAGVRVLLDTMAGFFPTEPRGGLRRIAVSILFSFLLLVALDLSVVVVLSGDWLFGAIRQALPAEFPLHAALTRISDLWLNLRYLLLFSFVLLLVLSLYRLGLSRRGVDGRVTLVCALLCAAALVAASALFSEFIGMSARYSLLYGSLASIIILLVWLYLCGYILLLGALAAAVWSRRHPCEKTE